MWSATHTLAGKRPGWEVSRVASREGSDNGGHQAGSLGHRYALLGFIKANGPDGSLARTAQPSPGLTRAGLHFESDFQKQTMLDNGENCHPRPISVSTRNHPDLAGSRSRPGRNENAKVRDEQINSSEFRVYRLVEAAWL